MAMKKRTVEFVLEWLLRVSVNNDVLVWYDHFKSELIEAQKLEYASLISLVEERLWR